VRVPGSERREHAGSTIVGPAATKPDYDFGGALCQRRIDELPHPVGTGDQGVALALPKQVQTAGMGGLDVRRASICAVNHEDHGRDRTPKRVANGDADSRPAQSSGQDFKESGSAVGERYKREVVLGGAAPPAFSDRLGGLTGSQGARETVGGNEDSHNPMLSGMHGANLERHLLAATRLATQGERATSVPMPDQGPPSTRAGHQPCFDQMALARDRRQAR
jgi:hypothetical protein